MERVRGEERVIKELWEYWGGDEGTDNDRDGCYVIKECRVY